MPVNITKEELATSARTFRTDLIAMNVIGLQRSLQYMTLRTGIRHSETVGELEGDIEVGPYSEDRVDSNAMNIVPRTLRTYFGNTSKNFSPNSVASTVYGSAVKKGADLTEVKIAELVLAFLQKKMSKSLNKNLFKAVRKDGGTKTVDLFDGFDTIAEKDITAGDIATAKKNLYEFSAAINRTNACDSLKAFYRAASDELKDEETVLFCDHDTYNAYCDCYKDETGATAYNKQYEQVLLEGSNGNCKLVPLASKAGTKFLQLTTEANMLVGVDGESDQETISIGKYSSWKLTYEAAMFFGTQYESVSPERLLIGKLFTA